METIESIITKQKSQLGKESEEKRSQEKWDGLKKLLLDLNKLNAFDFKKISDEVIVSLSEIEKSVKDKEMICPPFPTISFDKVISKLGELQMGLKELVERKQFDPSLLIKGIDKLGKELKPIKQEKVNFSDVITAVRKVEETLKKLKLSVTTPITKVDLKPLLSAIKNLDIKPIIQETKIDLSVLEKATKEINETIKKLKFPENEIDLSKVTEATENVETAIRSLRFPVPTPVTQIDVNPLRGVFKTTAVSVGTTSTALPATNLANRRSIIVYNNDATAILYIGGSDVSTTNGVPVAAATFSAPVDAGSSMTLYGVSSSGTINIRVLEMSNDNVGSS